jgi:hypothetical protein
MSVLVPTDRSIRVAAGVAAILAAFTVSALARPVSIPVNRDHRGEAAKPLPATNGGYDPAKATIRDHRSPKPLKPVG